MLRNGIVGGKQEWRCGVERREKARRYHDSLEHVAWSKRLLQMRRAHAMWARRRKESRGSLPREG